MFRVLGPLEVGAERALGPAVRTQLRDDATDAPLAAGARLSFAEAVSLARAVIRTATEPQGQEAP